MTSRVSYWSDEQMRIQITYDVARAKENADALIARIDSLASIGCIQKKEVAQMKKSIAAVIKQIAAAGEICHKKK